MALSSVSVFRRLYSPPRALSSRVCYHRHLFGAASMAKTNIFLTEEDLAEYTAPLSHKFSSHRASFSLVLPGGSFVNSLRKLVEPPYIDTVEWSKWRVFWVHEKTIPKDQNGCNYKLAYDCFLSQVPILPGNVFSINEALSAEGAADDYETCLRHLVKCGVIELSSATGLPKFDLMLMGIDPDGHIAASEFPGGHPFLQEDTRKWVTFLHESSKPPVDTITLTLTVINSSAYMAMVATGGRKASSPSNSIENSRDSTVKMPILWVSPDEGELTWFLTGDVAETIRENS